MPKEKEEKDDQPQPFDPSKPLEDADDEEEVQKRFRLTQRLKHLETQAETDPKNKKKKSRLSW